MQALITLDVGTTGVKAALVDRNGRVLARDSRTYGLSVRGDRVEQEPGDWWEGAAAVLASVARHAERSSVAGLCLSGQMQNLIAIDDAGAAGPAILYSDMRAREQARSVAGTFGAEALMRRTGNLQDAAGLPAKLLWLREHDPRRYSRARRILFGAHDYVAWKLTGAEATDCTTLSTTGLLDIRENTYAFDVTDALGFPRSLFPPLVAADHVDGGISPEAARAVGLPAGVPVFHGCGDAGSATVGAGAGVPGALSCYLGTSGWLAATAAGGLADPAAGLFNLRHPDGASVIHIGPMLLAAGNVDWAIEAIGAGPRQEDPHASFTREAAAAQPGSGGLLYLPYLVGERSPFRDPLARGAFIGLGRSTGRAEMSRAVLEGVAFAMRSIFEAMGGTAAAEALRAGAVPPARRLSLSGGGARSTLWPQVFADVFNCEVSVDENAADAGLIGAFVIAARALGWLDGWTPPPGSLGAQSVFKPRREARGAYDRAYAVFRGLYPALRGSFAALYQEESGGRQNADFRT